MIKMIAPTNSNRLVKKSLFIFLMSSILSPIG
jgi:hypothetical protein